MQWVSVSMREAGMLAAVVVAVVPTQGLVAVAAVVVVALDASS